MAGNYSVKVTLKPLQSGKVWSLPIATCFEKCSTTQCFMVLRLYNTAYDAVSGEGCEEDINIINAIIIQTQDY